MLAYCGDVEVTPIHPFTLEQRVSDTDAIREGLYVFESRRTRTAVQGGLKLVVYSEKDPQKQDSRVVDPQIVERIWQDFGPYRTQRPPI